MKFCQYCGNQLLDAAVMCPKCGKLVEAYKGYNANPTSQPTPTPQPVTPPEEDKASVLLCILAFLIPLFGIIYWAIMHNDKPKSAKACGISAIVSIIVVVVLTIIAYLLTFFLIVGIVGAL